MTRFLLLFALSAAALLPAQPLDEAYTAKIREYTTEPFFLTELVDHLPASATVPAPDKVIGHVAGAPDRLTYSSEIYAYLRALEQASPRVKVFSIGRTEENREMVLAVVSSEENIAKLDRLREITARLADPRKTGEEEARKLIAEGVPMYWATGAMHSSETGSPEMLMELAYRLAVEETPFIQGIRRNLVVMITPVLEVDGRDRYVDVYRYRKAHPDKPAPPLVYWGKYVSHDNNRDAITMALALSRNMMRTFLEWHPQVLHDLHESIPFLYTSTGMGPYNAWLDPIVINEWQALAYHEVGEMTKRGVPGVWTHGFYDGWAANYMFYVANGHNSIGRFYETFGGVGADTVEREVDASYTKREWFRPNPPLAKVKWSLRNNVNLQQSALLLAMKKVADERERFLENFYLKGKRSIAKAANEGPAAWVIPADDPRPVECAGLVNLLQAQGVEVQRLDRAVEVVEKAKPAAKGNGKETSQAETKRSFPADSYVIRMDQPYSRMADMLLDTQYYDAKDTRPYDDTGWTLGALRNIATVRVTDASILKAEMRPVDGQARVEGRVRGPENAAAYIINHNTDNTLATFRFRLRDVEMFAAEEPFKAEDRDFNAGSFIILKGDRDRIAKAAVPLGLTVYAARDVPKVAMHPLRAPRVALVHTWQSTQNEGWMRIALDNLEIPYHYVSDHALRDTADLRSKFDVIIFGPTSGAAQRIVNGLPMRGQPVPWKGGEEMPNVATSPDQTDDIRGGMGLEGLINVRRFVEEGGVFITAGANAAIPVDYGLLDGVSIERPRTLQARGSVLNSTIADARSPIAYGYKDKLAVYFSQAPVFQVSATGGYGWRFADDEEPPSRPSGRGAPGDHDVPQGRPFAPPEAKPERKPYEEPEIPEEYLPQIKNMLPAPGETPRVVFRFADEKDLLVSGMLAGGRELAGRPAVVDVPVSKGHFVLFANNPTWRNETQGSFFLLFNTLMNYDNLNAGRSQR